MLLLNKVTKNNLYYEINNKKRENIIRKKSGQAMVMGFGFSIINNQFKGIELQNNNHPISIILPMGDGY